jgi:hypothetical protein
MAARRPWVRLAGIYSLGAIAMKTNAAAYALVALAALPCFGQTNFAKISGVITDPQGAVVPQAHITAIGTQKGEHYEALSNTAGFYSIPNLPIGTYTLAIEKPGFRNYLHEAFTLTTGQELGLDAHLEIGGTGQTVTVAGEPPPLETRTSDISQLIEAKSIDALPLGNRRTLNSVELMGGAVFVSYNNSNPANVVPAFNLAGGRSGSQAAFIDGGNAQNMRLGVAEANVDPPVEAIAEVKVLTNNYSAEYGGSASGVIIETTKSGGNMIHGSVYEFLRNNDFDAPGFFAPVVGGSKVSPELRYNVFGGTVSGPIQKNKTFFFFDYEGVRLATGTTTTLTVPSAMQAAGDFSQTLNATGKLIPIYDPDSTQLVNGAYTRTQFPNNVIPASALDPVALKVMQYYPRPNQAPNNLAGANNFSGNSATRSPANFYIIKPEHVFSEKDKIYGYYLYDAGTTSIRSIYPLSGAGDPATHASQKWQYVYGSWTHVANPSQINELRFAFNDHCAHTQSQGLGGNYPSKLGLAGVPDDAFPQWSPAGFSSLGAASQERIQCPSETHQVIDNYSWIKGRHSIKFGFEFRRSFNEDIDPTTVSGSSTFATTPTGLPGNAATGSGLASMLVGFPTAFSETSTQALDRHSYYIAAFVQDDWTVKPNLTFNLGLRWETDTPMIDENGRMNSFDASKLNPVSGTPGVVTFIGLNGTPKNPYGYQWTNFGPRFGFAWKPLHSEKTVIRGGFGIFFAHPFDAGVPLVNVLGFSTALSLSTPDNGITAPFRLRSGVPQQPTAPVLNDSFGAVKVGQATTTAVTYFDRTRGTGYSKQFNFGVQREVPAQIVVAATFLGNLSRKLPSSPLSLNQILPSALGPSCSTQACRPYPQFNNVSIQSPTIGESNYYGLVLRLEKRYSHGLNIGVAYTWSKYLSNTNEVINLGNNNGPYSNYYNRRADYGPDTNDVRSHLVFNWVYELPFGLGKRWLANNPLRYVVGGWSLGNVTTIQSGPPVTVITQTNNCNCFSAGAQRPNVSGTVTFASPGVAAWFNTAAFSQPATFTFGNEGVGIIRAVGIMNTDLSVIRSFKTTEKSHLELRGEFFNATNHTNLGLPGLTYGSSTFGVVSSAGAARTVEIGVRFAF